MRFRHFSPLIALALLAAGSAASARAEAVFDVVSGGEVQLQGGEQVCFTFDREDLREVQVRVRLRFTSWVPRGRVELDGISGASFQEPSEEFVFWVEPRGVHRLRVELDESATVDRLSLVTTAVRVEQTSCRLYEGRSEREIEPETPEPLNRLGRPEPPAEPPPEPPPAAEPERPAERPETAASASAGTLPAGSSLVLELQSELDTRRAYAGQSFSARLSEPARSNGRTLLPAGSVVRGRVAEAKDAGRFGRSRLTLAFERVSLPDGRDLPLSASLQRLGRGSAKKQGGIIAGSAAGGALLGQLLGGDSESTVLGAVLGGAIAAGSIAAEPGKPVVLPAGTLFTVALDGPLEVPASR